MGYLQGSRAAPSASSVTVNEGGAYPGWNLVVSAHAPEAYVMDMAGVVAHRWGRAFADSCSTSGKLEPPSHRSFWRHAHLLPGGGLLAIFDGLCLIKLDRASNLVWMYDGRAHHDLFVSEEGLIYVLTRRRRGARDGWPVEGSFLEDFVTVLSPEGQELDQISLLDCMLDSEYAPLLDRMERRGDLFHTNTLELLEDRFVAGSRMFDSGNALISIPKLNTIAVIDLEERRAIWALSGKWLSQHQRRSTEA